MNKPYFAKYLPVEGEIKEGDLFTCPHRGHSIDVGNGIPHAPKMLILRKDGGLGASRTCPDCRRVKLFLCSRDIGLHEECYLENNKVVLNQVHVELRSKCYKIIGEISPEATWVKEGDEFDEEEIKITEQCPHYGGKHMWKDCSCKTGFIKGVYVRCPTCHNFH